MNAYSDQEIACCIQKELERQETGLEMIPSENYASRSVMAAVGSILTNKYSEGYPHKRYYGGNQFIDEIEDIAVDRAKRLFGVPHVNVQPYSGSPANQAVYLAACLPGDAVMGQSLPDGGHLTHGWKTSFSGLLYNTTQYHVKLDGYIDIDEARRLANEHRPKLIWIGASAYPRSLPFKELSEIAESVGAYLAADIAHVAGLIVGGVHPSPVPYAHVITTTTHKTLRGPRGAMIMVTEKGLAKDPDLPAKIDRAVFPGLQGGPHDHVTAGIAIALKEASEPSFKEYARQIIRNAQALADEFSRNKFKVVSGGTDNHLLLLDLTPYGVGKGVFAQDVLEEAGITVNKNTIPGEPSSPFYPSGIRMGSPALTTRGMKEPEMKIIAGWISELLEIAVAHDLPEDKTARAEYLKEFRAEIRENSKVRSVRRSVMELCRKFPVYP